MARQTLGLAIRLALCASIGTAPAVGTCADPVASGTDDGRNAIPDWRSLERHGEALTVYTREDIARTGLTSIGEFLQQLPQSGEALNTRYNGGGNGQTQLNLRGLGPKRTLVLVDGRRWIAGAGGAVDLNTIPLPIIERVEILLDGASSIYGSDAIAGVVNIVTRASYDGAEANAYLGQNQRGDGRIEAYDFTIGANTEKANVVMNVSYTKQEPISAGDRSVSATPVANIPGNNSNVSASSTTPFGRFFLVGSFPTSVTFDPTTGGYRPYNGNVDGFNFAPDNYLSTPQERTALFVQARYQITDGVAFKTDVLFNERESQQQFAATPLTLGAAFGIPIAIEPGQESNPFHVPITRAQYRPFRFKRQFDQDVQTYRFSGGFEGQFSLLDRNWSWDANYTYTQNNSNTITSGLVDIPNLLAGLQPGCTVANSCVPLDIFHGPDAFTREMFDSISFIAHDSSLDRLWNYTANITGDLFELPAGPLGFAAGYEYRRLSSAFEPDALVSSGVAFGADPSNPYVALGRTPQSLSGGYALDEFYGKANVPILKDMTFAQLLELNLAVRYSDYSNFGSTTNPKAGFRWKPISDLLVRGYWSKGFRAPSISELFEGRFDTFPTLFDPCAVSIIDRISAEAQSRCYNGFAGIAPVPHDRFDFGPTQIRTTVGGNPDLRPERAISKTLGLVYSPSWVPRLDLHLDWYDIQLRDAVGAASAQLLLDSCYLAGNASACHAAELTREASYGEITNLFAGAQNLQVGMESEGYEFTLNYNLDTRWGKFTWNWDNAYTSYFGELGKPKRLDCVAGVLTPLGEQTICTGLLATGNQAGNYLAFDPKWRLRSNLTSNWSYGDWGATLGFRYYSGLDEDCSFPTFVGYADLCSDPNRIVELYGDGVGYPTPQNHLGARTYIDLQGTWDAPWNARFTAGVNNVFDRDPPTSYSGIESSIDPMYPVPGRFWYLSYQQRF